MPILACFLLLFTLASIGLPGLNGFVGEFLVLVGMFQRGWSGPVVEWTGQYRIISVLAVLGVVLGAWYMLWLVERTFFGRLKSPDARRERADLSAREIVALVPLVVFIFWIGLVPDTFLRPMQVTLNQVNARIEEVTSPPPMTAGSSLAVTNALPMNGGRQGHE